MNRIEFTYAMKKLFPGMSLKEIAEEIARLKQLEKDIVINC